MGKHINEIYHTNITLNGIYITYCVLWRFSQQIVYSVLLESNLTSMPKLRRILMIGQQSNLCQCQSLKTSYHSKIGWLP